MDNILILCRDVYRYGEIRDKYFSKPAYKGIKFKYISNRSSALDVMNAARGYQFDLVLYDEHMDERQLMYLHVNMTEDAKILPLKLYFLKDTLKKL